MNGSFTVIPVDGDAIEAGDPLTQSLHFDGLSWPEAVELARMSFMQGFEVIIWRTVEGGGNGATESC